MKKLDIVHVHSVSVIIIAECIELHFRTRITTPLYSSAFAIPTHIICSLSFNTFAYAHIKKGCHLISLPINNNNSHIHESRLFNVNFCWCWCCWVSLSPFDIETCAQTQCDRHRSTLESRCDVMTTQGTIRRHRSLLCWNTPWIHRHTHTHTVPRIRDSVCLFMSSSRVISLSLFLLLVQRTRSSIIAA